MKKIRVRYFAIMRDLTKKSDEEVQTSALTAGDLYQELEARYPNFLAAKVVRVAVNDHFVPMAKELRDGDRVAFIPPVAGG
jgi:molybdopterin synthase sulfur carrier subunit